MKIRNYLFALTIFAGVSGITTSVSANESVNVIPVSSVSDRALVSKEDPASTSLEEKQARITAIRERVNEIKAMDKSTLTREERKILKTELKDMNHEARAMRERRVTGVYLSIGAVLIIILLLIIIL